MQKFNHNINGNTVTTNDDNHYDGDNVYDNSIYVCVCVDGDEVIMVIEIKMSTLKVIMIV